MADVIERVEVLVSSPSRNYVTLRLATRDGIVGLGDATVNGRELAAASYLRDHVGPLLIGRDPARMGDTWQYLYREALPHAWHVADGHLQPGDEPGLGVSLNDDLHRPDDYEPAYLPVARRRDGTLTDW